MHLFFSNYKAECECLAFCIFHTVALTIEDVKNIAYNNEGSYLFVWPDQREKQQYKSDVSLKDSK